MENQRYNELINKKIQEVNQLRSRAEQEFNRVRKDLEKSKQRAEWYVRMHPRRATMMTFGIGMMVGIALSCASKRKKNRMINQ